MLTSVTKDFFFFSFLYQRASIPCCVQWLELCGLNVEQEVSYKNWQRGVRGYRKEEKRREGKSSVTSNSNNSSLNPKKFLLQRKCQSYRKPETIKNVSSCQVRFFCHWQEKQTGGRVPAHASACSDPTMHRDTCRKTDLQAEETLDTEKLTVFARGLKGIFCFIP